MLRGGSAGMLREGSRMRLPRLVAFVPRAVAIAAATGLAGVAGALGLA